MEENIVMKPARETRFTTLEKTCEIPKSHPKS